MANQDSSALSRRDYFVLPLISVFTIIAILATAEICARIGWPEQKIDACEVKDPYLRFAAKPNCASRVKIMDGPWVVNQYNNCGFRSAAPCGPKPAGGIRVALIGSSFAQGYMVSYEQTFAARSETLLSHACSRPVEFQNDSQPDISILDIYHRLDRELRLNPDVVLVVITPLDLQRQLSDQDLADRDSHLPVNPASVRPPDTRAFRKLREDLSESRALAVGKLKLFENQDLFLRRFLLLRDDADYLRTPNSPAWEERYAHLDLLLEAMQARAAAHGAQVVLMPGIMRPQAAAFEAKSLPAGIDPYDFERRCESIAHRHSIVTINPYEAFRTHPDSDKLFYILDGHLNQSGQAVLAHSLVEQLVDGQVGAFAACKRPVGTPVAGNTLP